MVNEQILLVITQENILKELWKNYKRAYKIDDSRVRKNVLLRYAFILNAKKHSNLSLKTLGNLIERDHATVIHAQKAHETNFLYDDTYRKIYSVMSDRIKKALLEYRLETAEELVESLGIDVDPALEIKVLKKNLKALQEEIEMLQDLHKKEKKAWVRQTKDLQERNEKLHDMILDLKRRV